MYYLTVIMVLLLNGIHNSSVIKNVENRNYNNAEKST